MDTITLLPSLILAVMTLMSLFFLKPNRLSFFIGLLCSISLVSLGLFTIANHLSRDGFNVAAINHLKYLLEFKVLIQFYKETIGVFFFIIFVFIISRISFKNTLLKNKLSQSLSVFITILGLTFSLIGLAINPFVDDVKNLISYYHLTKKEKLPKDFAFLEHLVIKPRLVRPTAQKNFIIIFSESLEKDFFNEKEFPDLTPKLNKLTSIYGTDVIGTQNLKMTDWTYTGIEAAMCGTINIQAVNPAKELNCIGNILSNDGYHLTFIGGSNFALDAKSSLFQKQGFQQVLAFDEIQKYHKNKYQKNIPEMKWGAYDESTFEYANHFLDSKESSNQPHGLVVLTVDTHIPGFVSPNKCQNINYRKKNTGDEMLSAVKCADSLISEFIEKHLEEYDIFLISDHLIPGDLRLVSKVFAFEQRNLVFTHFSQGNKLSASPKAIGNINRPSTSIDFAPTILDRLGYGIQGLNLGKNLFDPTQKTLNESLGYDVLYDNSINIQKMHIDFIQKKH